MYCHLLLLFTVYVACVGYVEAFESYCLTDTYVVIYRSSTLLKMVRFLLTLYTGVDECMNRRFGLSCSCDLDPMTFIYEYK